MNQKKSRKPAKRAPAFGNSTAAARSAGYLFFVQSYLGWRSGTPGYESKKISKAREAGASFRQFNGCRPLRGLLVFSSILPGVERSGTPGYESKKISKAREAGASFRQFNGCRPLRGLTCFLFNLTWGSAALHPRLYAAARCAGYLFFVQSYWGSLCSTPGFTLPPTPRTFPK
jgi:hypothetical protein